MKVTKGLCTSKYTEVFCEDIEEQKYNAPHHFTVKKVDPVDRIAKEIICKVDFQEGPIREVGINGIHNEDLILMVLTRLESFQESKYACKENEMAIIKLEESLMWLRKRTTDRELRNVEGTSIV